jgi:Na+-translocating ferredoxin:NAD+ oxidoreductase RnfC subunit
MHSTNMATTLSSELAAIRSNGIVGAGGAGFPAYAKFTRSAHIVIVNGAECEPLMHKDKEVMHHFAAETMEGLRKVMRLVGAAEGVVAIKYKYEEVIESIRGLTGSDTRIAKLGDYYPTGDEFILVREVTGAVIPPGKLPLDVGVVVSNVETLVNIARGKPVTDKYLTVAGAVANPVTVCVPVGTSYQNAIAMAGGASVGDYAMLIGGAMMGALEEDPGRPITRTCGGILVLPSSHPLIQRRRLSMKAVTRIGKSACDQCSLCTELCPRFLLGHPIEPHKAMRALTFSSTGTPMVSGTEFCCECNLCTLYACPEDLDPKNICWLSKQQVRESGGKHALFGQEVHPHPMSEFRRAPLPRLIKKLGLHRYSNRGPLLAETPTVKRVVLPFKQHIGAAAVACVRIGDRVHKGDLVADVPADQLGAPIHASISGRIAAIHPEMVIEA